MTNKQIEDCILLTARGDMDALHMLYEAVFADVYKYLYTLCREHYIAEDMAQNTFIKVLRGAESYRSANAKAWLFRIAHNEYVSYLRGLHGEISAELSHADGDGGEWEERCVNTILLRNAMSVLSNEESNVISMRLSAGLRFREIAEATGLPMGTVTGIYRRAAGKIKKYINGGSEHDEKK